MHVLVSKSGRIEDGSDFVDLGQQPGDIVILSAADSELGCLARALERLNAHQDEPVMVRLAHLSRLKHPLSVDTYIDSVIKNAKLVIIRLLGGRSYWSYGLDEVVACCQKHNIALALLPGDDRPDNDLMRGSSLTEIQVKQLWHYLVYGGGDNAFECLKYATSLINLRRALDYAHPKPLAPMGHYRSIKAKDGAIGQIILIFYRAMMLADDVQPVDDLLEALSQQQMDAHAYYVQSLKDNVAVLGLVAECERINPDVIVNMTSFATSQGGAGNLLNPLEIFDCPVIQVIFSSQTSEQGIENQAGLTPSDLAMNVVLPEMDGRIISTILAFKSRFYHALSQAELAFYVTNFVMLDSLVTLIRGWALLRHLPVSMRHIGLILANYPNRDARIGNGVGLDTPASVMNILTHCDKAGYQVKNLPLSGQKLIEDLQQGVTNNWHDLKQREVRITLPLSEYKKYFAALPPANQEQVLKRWGLAEDDPFVQDGAFALAILDYGHIVVGLQPARGYNIDPVATAHDPDLVPPHNYLAFYMWLRFHFKAHALVHVGKHGNVEWLPGHSVGLSHQCWPQVLLCSIPHLYPFIVNDPGEGTQAKRRGAAVIIDHLTPPLTRADTYGDLRVLEGLLDEYYTALSLDNRRAQLLKQQIFDLMTSTQLAQELPQFEQGKDQTLVALDSYLCDIKESQIKDGLHVFGHSPRGEQRLNLLQALVRVPRGKLPFEQSLLKALAEDLGLDFDPLDCVPAESWQGTRPVLLSDYLSPDSWRNVGDVIEKLEYLSQLFISEQCACPADFTKTRAILDFIRHDLAPRLDQSGTAEIEALLHGLDGGFVLPGSSGAPTRGRLDVLPTGRNFYGIDSRAVPTKTAWALGWKSAHGLLERHYQDHGEWPSYIALSAWGTSCMRTGGDDIAQALALMGVKPEWDTHSGRVVGFEILPLSLLDRPRVDVTLRVSGLFRDAFPTLMDLFDSAVRAVALLAEPAEFNPLAASYQRDLNEMGESAASSRLFSAKPGSYGAGLQTLIDEKIWQSDHDFKDAFIAWGGWAYGGGRQGEAAQDHFAHRLRQIQVVVHNQDNREHDLLDSDDYYQFEGGLSSSVRALSGKDPIMYHMDHSRPEHPVARNLEEEINRVMRARVLNPKWIKGVMRHGYKGGFEMAASVDYLFAFAATTKAVKTHHFDGIASAFLADPEVHSFLQTHNPAALDDIKTRLQEAWDRGLWRPYKNSLLDLL